MFHEQDRSSRVIVVVPDSIPSENLSKTLRFILKTKTYLDFKKDSFQFWTRLRAAITDPGMT